MSKWLIDIHGEIEGDYELICKAENIISLDKIKQAKEEIDDLDRYFDNDYFSSNRDAMFKCSEVLEILDKLIAESEVEE